jgi:hypothetical protein
VDVVGHDHDVAHVVETSVIPEHLVSQLDCTSRISQVTFTEAAVQAALGLAIEMLLEPNLFEGRQSVKGVAPAAAFAVVGDAESFERLTLLLLPLSSHALRYRISESKRHKVRTAILPPVRQVPLVDPHGTKSIERHKPCRP